jgi:hypothetical protein
MPLTAVRRAGFDTSITNICVSAYTIPTDAPEADGTLDWHQTTIVIVEVDGGGKRGLGYSYIDAAQRHDAVIGYSRERRVLPQMAAALLVGAGVGAALYTVTRATTRTHPSAGHLRR